MRHVFLTQPGKYELVETEDPVLQKPTDVIVRITGTTVCGSDVHLIQGHMGPGHGFALGHECVGTVHACGDAVEGFSVGDRVVVPPKTHSSYSQASRDGQIQADENGGIFGSGMGLGGAMAEYLRVDYADSSLVRIPDGVSDRQALLAGDMLQTGYTAVRRAATVPGASLVVFGVGPVGLSAIATARLAGAVRVVAVDTVPERLELARTLGATHPVNSREEEVADAVAAATNGAMADAVVDAAGVQPTISAWPAVARPGAHVAMVAIPGRPVELPLNAMQNRNMTIWTGLGELTHIERLLDLMDAGIFDPTPLLTHEYTFNDIEQTITDTIERRPGLVKPYVTVG